MGWDWGGGRTRDAYLAARLRGRTLDAINGGVIDALNHVHENLSADERKEESYLGAVCPREGREDGWDDGQVDAGNWIYSCLVEC